MDPREKISQPGGEEMSLELEKDIFSGMKSTLPPEEN